MQIEPVVAQYNRGRAIAGAERIPARQQAVPVVRIACCLPDRLRQFGMTAAKQLLAVKLGQRQADMPFSGFSAETGSSQ